MGVAVGAALLKAGQAVVEFGKESVQMAMDFETSMNSIVALVGVAEQQVDDWSDAILDTAASLRTAPQDLADAMFFITSAGLRGETAMDALTVSAQAAASGLGDITQVADAVTSAMNAYGWETVSAEQATDVLVATVREGKLEASELAGVIGRLTPLAAEMGVEFNEVGGILAALTRVGFSAAEASTSLMAIMSELLKPTTEAEAALAAVGMSAAGLRQSIREDGLTATLQDLYEALGKDSVALAEVFANTRSLRGVLPLVGTQADTVTGIMESLADATGATAQAFEDTADTMEQRMAVATVELQVEMTRLGESIGQISVPIRALIKGALAELLKAFNDIVSRRREAIENVDILSNALMGIGTLSDFERALELQQQNVDLAQVQMDRARDLRNAVVEQWGAESGYAREQQTRMNEAMRALGAQENMYADLRIMAETLREAEAKVAEVIVEDVIPAVYGLQGVAKESGDGVQTMTDKWRNWQLILRGIPEDIGTAATSVLSLGAAFGELSGMVITAGWTIGHDFGDAIDAIDFKLAKLKNVSETLTKTVVESIDEISFKLIKLKELSIETAGALSGAAGVGGSDEAGGSGVDTFGDSGIALGNLGGIDAGVETAFAEALSSAIPELAQLATVAGVLSLMFEGFTSVVGEMVSGPLAMLFGAIKQVGVFFGTILAPWIQVVVDAFQLVAAGAVWFYNQVWRRIGNGFVAVFKAVQTVIWGVLEGITRMINGVINLINKIPGVNIGNVSNPISPTDWSTGWLKEIGLGDLTGDVGDDTTETPGGGTGATFRQQRPIEVTVNVFDNQVFGGNLQEFGLLIRDELLQIAELGL